MKSIKWIAVFLALLVCLLAIILSSYGKGMVKMSSIVIPAAPVRIRAAGRTISI